MRFFWSRAPNESAPPLDEMGEDAYDILNSDWLNAVPDEGMHELEDYQVNVPTESPFVTAMRKAKGGPYIIAPDSADWVPPDLLATSDTKKVEETTRRKNKELDAERVPEGQVAVPHAQQSYLKKLADRGNEPAARLLDVLGRGLEASSHELDRAVDERRRR